MDKEYMKEKIAKMLYESIFDETAVAAMMGTTATTLKSIISGLPARYEEKTWENIEMFIKNVVLELEEIAYKLQTTPPRFFMKRAALHKRRSELMNLDYSALKN